MNTEQHNLTSPCHSAPILVTRNEVTDDTRIICLSDGCPNTWDKNGEPE